MNSLGQLEQESVSESVMREMIAREIRIQQAVEMYRAMPVFIIGNLMMMLVLYAVYPALIVSSGAVYPFAAIVILVLVVFRMYLKLRGRERPKDVSHRRITFDSIGAIFGGVAWAVFSLLALSESNSETAIVIALLMVSYTMISLLTLTAQPIAALLIGWPVLIVNAIMFLFFGLLPVLVCGAFFGSVLVLSLYCIWSNWERTLMNVRLQVENTLAEAERAQSMERVSTRLSKYLSPQLFQEIVSGRQTEAIISKRKKLTVFFSDIVGFTEITDNLESEELAALLNRYLTEMTAIAEQHGGTVDKFIGDAVVVYFGDPGSLGPKKDAEACVRMALAMKDRVQELKQEWVDLGLLDGFDLRIGINTGYCNVGNFGSAQRVDHTIVGNEVNLAARLESAAGDGGILISGKTYALVKEMVIAEENEPLGVKGFARPVRTFLVRAAA